MNVSEMFKQKFKKKTWKEDINFVLKVEKFRENR